MSESIYIRPRIVNITKPNLHIELLQKFFETSTTNCGSNVCQILNEYFNHLITGLNNIETYLNSIDINSINQEIFNNLINMVITINQIITTIQTILLITIDGQFTNVNVEEFNKIHSEFEDLLPEIESTTDYIKQVLSVYFPQ